MRNNALEVRNAAVNWCALPVEIKRADDDAFCAGAAKCSPGILCV